jgi:hypothetical protein
MPVKGHLRHAAFLNNPVYADRMNPVPVKELSRRLQNAVSGRDAFGLARLGLWSRGLLHSIARKDTAARQVCLLSI